MPFANTSTSPGTRVSEGTKRVGSAGFGRSDGEVGMDPELEELIAAEELRYEPAPVQEGGYHRVGGMQEGGVQVTPGCEGYFELCVKSVEAILWDPEAEVQTDDSAAKRLVSR
jgi:NADH dehydrogenase [ubiquinone] 1 alpha subcomplex assembly factor 1